MRFALAFGAQLLALSSATEWYAAYNLNEAEILAATQAGCYRGNYGGVTKNGDPRTLSLLTCPQQPGDMPFATTDDDAFLCVIELKDPAFLEETKSIIDGHGATRILFEGQQELVIMSAERTDEKPQMCCPIHFENLADNTLYVPITPFKEPDPIPMWHPRVRAAHEAILSKNFSSLQQTPEIRRLLTFYNRNNVETNVRVLSTGTGGTSTTTITRNSYSIRSGVGGCSATVNRCAFNVVNDLTNTIRGYFTGYTANTWTVTPNTFRTDMCNNLILEVRGRDNTNIIVTGAHLDSRNTNSGSAATGQAPGADDNGSGSAIQLEMARVIGTQNARLSFTMRIMWFCGEEQGLLGSRALASSYRQRGDRLLGMFNMDMIGYRRPNLASVMSFMTGNANRALSDEIKAFSRTYLPSLQLGDTSACCSDQQSFHLEGFRAAGIFETPTSGVVYPEYHRTTDTHNNGLLNYEQIFNFGYALFAAILEYAQPLAADVEE